MSGKAMLTMNRSRLAMNSPTEVINRIFQRLSIFASPIRVACLLPGTVYHIACKKQGRLARLGIYAHRSLRLAELLHRPDVVGGWRALDPACTDRAVPGPPPLRGDPDRARDR